MADFIVSEAEESENEEELDELEKKRLRKLKAAKESEDEDEEEDDDERLKEELKDLIDDNPIEDDESGEESGSEGGRGRKRSREDEDELDDNLEEDDYELLEENLGVKVKRKKQFRRVQRLEDDESEDEGGDGRDRVANELFEGSDNEAVESESPERRPRDEEEVGEDDEESDADDFIVDDDGKPIGGRKKKPIFTDQALQTAQDTFGVDFDFEEFMGDEEAEEEDSDVDYDDEEGGRKKTKKVSRKKGGRKSIFELYEPSELERGHFTDFDVTVRETDIPERMQLRGVPVTSASDSELDKEADWIYRQAFMKPTVSKQEWWQDYRKRLQSERDVIQKIRKALEHMRNQHLEVPFIAFYRKETIYPELDINDLWRIYKYDEKWCQLQSRKTNLMRLLRKMQKFQGDKIMEARARPLDDSTRILNDEDIDKVEDAVSMEELRDHYIHFMLYYGDEVPVMQEADRQKRREEYKRRMEQRERRRQRLEAGEEVDEPMEEDIDEPPPPEEDETVKQAKRSDLYTICKRAGLDGLAMRFGLTPEQFGENLRDGYQRHEVEQYAVGPVECATEFANDKFKDPNDALRAAKYMVAMQLAREPMVRHCVREIFYERVRINVRPTKQGLKEIDENHQLYSMRYLKDKPVGNLMGDQFVKLIAGEKDKLIVLEFDTDIKGTTSPSYLEEIKQLYIRDEFSRHVQEWNKIRGEAIEESVKKILFPAFILELRTILTKEAQECILRACCSKLYNYIKVGPYPAEFPDEEEDEWDTKDGIRVLSFAFIPDYNAASFAVMLTTEGEVNEYIRLEHLLKRRDAWRDADRKGKSDDMQRIKDFILNKKPHVICVGAESRDAERVVEDLRNVVKELVDEEQFPTINVELVDDTLAKVYANTQRAEQEFREFPELLRIAISLGRRVQDPLFEFSQLCGQDEEIQCLRFHSLQDQVPSEELLEALYFEFVYRTNEVGVDINRAINFPHTSFVVQFVCGLGPRKAAALMKTLKQTNQRLENRTQLVTHCHMGPKVFVNCAGFIKIDTNALGDSTETYIEVLDGTRVHPETYEWARKMAVDALEYDEEDANPGDAIVDILQNPEKLKELDLDAFANELERQNFGNKSITLYDIRAELNHRYKDHREPFRTPDPKERFQLLTKETPETLYRGRLTQATVTNFARRKPQREQLDHANPVRNEETGLWQCPFCLKNDYSDLSEVWNHFDAGDCQGQAQGVLVRMDNGLSGFIPIKLLSDKEVTNPEERVKPGQLIHVRISKVEEEKFRVTCTSRSSDLLDKENYWKLPKDAYYDAEAEAKDLQAEEDQKKQKERQTYTKRVIVHPNFHNIGYREAERKMATMDQGDVIVRPSSKGADHLTVTWKVTDGICQHIDVREEGKENSFSLGQTLFIGTEEFEDLDEIIARHVNPMAAFARDIMGYKYYKDFGLTRPENVSIREREKAEEHLREEKRKNPGKINYLISPSKEFPGKFLLSYMPRDRVTHEYITVTPEGFRFRGDNFDSFNQTLKWFKEHFRDRVPRPSQHKTPQVGAQTPGNRSVAGYHGAQTPGSYSNYATNTPYTPSGQTPFMTPFTSQTPRYTAPTGGGFAYGGITPKTPSFPSSSRQMPPAQYPPVQQMRPPQMPPQSRVPPGAAGADDWRKAAEAWARSRGAVTPKGGQTPRGATTPRYEDPRQAGSRTPGRQTPRLTPRRGGGTPMELGDSTPLYDER